MKNCFFALPLTLFLAGCQDRADAATYYVDYVAGNDSAAGTTPTTPWQHAPGDADATANAASTRLIPGDIVRFRGGVSYRGTIKALFDGVSGKPITYTGTGFGTGAAIIEGADPVRSITPCPSAAECGGSAQWPNLSIVTFTPPDTNYIKFYDADGILYESQSPAPPNRFYSDEVESFAVSPLADKAMIESGRLNAPAQAKLLGGVPSGVLQIWTYGNAVVRRPVTGVSGNILMFDATGITLYPDRPGRYALTGTAVAITGAGQYAVAGPGRAIVWTRPKGGLMVGSGRGGFDISERSFVTISGFAFLRQTASNTGSSEGFAITRRGQSGSGVIIENNRFENSSLWDGKGVISVSGVDRSRISNNTIVRIERGSGIRIGANTSFLTISSNRIDTIGRTGIAVLGASDSVVSGNIIANLKGNHGNGISLYLNNRRIQVVNNRIITTVRPMTFHGDLNTVGPGDHDFVIERNIFISSPNAQAALTSWGAATRGVTIRNNVLVASKAGLLANETDSGVTITGNYLSGIIFNKTQGADWTVGSNPIAESTLTYIPGDAVNNAKMCSGASVPANVPLGGVLC